MRIEFPSKPLSEVVSLAVDFISRLASGEVINSGSVVASLYTGTDTNPSEILDGATSVQGSQLVQSVGAGVLGNIYELAYTAVTSLNQRLVITGYLAVVPDLP